MVAQVTSHLVCCVLEHLHWDAGHWGRLEESRASLMDGTQGIEFTVSAQKSLFGPFSHTKVCTNTLCHIQGFASIPFVLAECGDHLKNLNDASLSIEMDWHRCFMIFYWHTQCSGNLTVNQHWNFILMFHLLRLLVFSGIRAQMDTIILDCTISFLLLNWALTHSLTSRPKED